MIWFNTRMTLTNYAILILMSGLITLSHISAQEPPVAENETKQLDQAKVSEEQNEGQDLLKQLREASEPLLAELAEKHGYQLEAGQTIRRVAPPFSELRAKYYKAGHPTQAQFIPTPADAMTFFWNGKQLTNWGMKFGAAYSIVDVVDNALKIKSQDVEGPKEILSRPLEGDWVIQPDAKEDKIVEELQTILQKEFKIRAELYFAKRIRTVYVANGKYEYMPIKRQGADPSSNQPSAIDEIEIYGATLGSNGAGGGSGDFDEFLRWVGRWIDMTVINEVKEPPTKQIGWNLNHKSPFTDDEYKADHDPETVLKNLTAQTGLIFKKDYRPIRRLVIKPIE